MVELKSGEEKLEDQLRVIGDLNGKNILNLLSERGLGTCNQDNEYGPHTLLKLAYLNYYLGVFLRIASSRKKLGQFDKIIFIDAFGGSGLVKIEDTKYAVLGSTLLAATDGRFDEVVSIDLNPRHTELLKKRCISLGIRNVRAIDGDANQIIPNLPVQLGLTRNSIVLLFIDPEGMEPEFSNFIPLSQSTEHIDFMLNYTWGVNRLSGRIAKSLKDADLSKMKKMIPNYEVGSNPDQKLLEFFENYFGKPVGHLTEVHSVGLKLKYSMVLRVRQTLGGSSWVNAMKEFGEYLSTTDGEKALTALRIVKGDQDTFF